MTTTSRKRSGISADRAYRIQAKAKTRIGDIMSGAAHFMSTSEQITAHVCTVFAEVERRKAPARVLSYLRGYYDARRDELYRTRIVWTMSVDGALYTSSEMRALDASEREAGLDKSPGYRSPWARCESDRSRHVWTDHEGNVRKDRSFDAKHRVAE